MAIYKAILYTFSFYLSELLDNILKSTIMALSIEFDTRKRRPDVDI
jgi:hypothetical protein